MAKKKKEDIESLTQNLVQGLPFGSSEQEPGVPQGGDASQPKATSATPKEDAVQPTEAPETKPEDAVEPQGKASQQEEALEPAPFADAPADPEEGAETGPGELTVSLPMGEEPTRLETIFLRVPKETKSALQGIAKRRKLSLNAFLAALLDDLAKKFGNAK